MLYLSAGNRNESMGPVFEEILPINFLPLVEGLVLLVEGLVLLVEGLV